MWTFVILGLVALCAIGAVALIVIRMLNAPPPPADGPSQPPPQPIPQPCTDPGAMNCGDTLCCPPGKCANGNNCCESDAGFACGPPEKQKCCRKDQCVENACVCTDQGQTSCGTDGCCPIENCSSKDQQCCHTEKNPICGTQCCPIHQCTTDSSKCCDTGTVPIGTDCLEICGGGTNTCPLGTKCMTWKNLTDCSLFKSPYMSWCQPETNGSCYINCLKDSESPNTKYIATTCMDVESACDYNAKSPLYRVPNALDNDAGTNFIPVLDLSLFHEQGATTDTWTDHNTSDVHIITTDAAKIASQGGDFRTAMDVIYNPEASAFSDSLRRKLVSPVGYACLDTNQTGYAWHFFEPPAEKKNTCGGLDCMKLATLMGDVSRVTFDEDTKLCSVEYCAGTSCSNIQCVGDNCPPPQSRSLLKKTNDTACTGLASVCSPASSKDDCNGTGCGAQLKRECNTNDMMEQYKSGLQLWPIGSRDFHFNMSNCSHFPHTLSVKETGNDADGDCRRNEVPTVVQGDNVTDEFVTSGPQDAFWWWNNSLTVPPQKLTMCVQDEVDDRTYHAVLDAVGPYKSDDPPGTLRQPHIHAGPTISAYASEMNFQYTGNCAVGGGNCHGAIVKDPTVCTLEK